MLERVERLILATDMRRHGGYTALLQHAAADPVPARALCAQPEARTAAAAECTDAASGAAAAAASPAACPAPSGDMGELAAAALFKCADLSNVIKEWPVAQRWAVRGPCPSAPGREGAMCEKRRAHPQPDTSCGAGGRVEKEEEGGGSHNRCRRRPRRRSRERERRADRRARPEVPCGDEGPGGGAAAARRRCC